MTTPATVTTVPERPAGIDDPAAESGASISGPFRVHALSRFVRAPEQRSVSPVLSVTPTGSPRLGRNLERFTAAVRSGDMLTFVGLGLYDERSVTVRGGDAIREANRVFAEFYTSRLAGTTIEALESYHDVKISVCDRTGVEQDPEPILSAADDGDAVFLTAGDTMISTTHVDLRLRAHERDVDTRVVHGTTAQSAASSLSGLQNYRFGKATTLPFRHERGGSGAPGSVLETIAANRERGLHTLVYLDINAERGAYMTADHAAGILADEHGDDLGVAIARAGSEEPVVAADRLAALAEREFGDPLHVLVIPGSLHHVEADALAELAGAPAALLDRV